MHLFLDKMFNGECPVILMSKCMSSISNILIPTIYNIVLFCIQATVSAFDEDADYDVLNHPIVDLIYYTVSNLLNCKFSILLPAVIL